MIATEKLGINGAYLIKGKRYKDERGFFEEIYSSSMGVSFVQDNISKSRPGVIRGLHMQLRFPQGKLVRCLSGCLLTVGLDVREDSQTYLDWDAYILMDQEPHAVYWPPNILHGLAVIGDQDAIAHYKVTTPHDRLTDTGVRWDSTDIVWPTEKPIISQRDKDLPTLKEFIDTLKRRRNT